MLKTNYEMIVSIVNRGYSDYVVNASREAGATGGTIVFARGTNHNGEKDSFMGVSIEPEKDIVLIIVSSEDRKKVMQHICDSTSSLQQEGNGICFSLPVTNAIGLRNIRKKHLLGVFEEHKKKAEERKQKKEQAKETKEKKEVSKPAEEKPAKEPVKKAEKTSIKPPKVEKKEK